MESDLWPSSAAMIDTDGNHWAYCHGTAAHVHQGQTIVAGTQILTSRNTGRSGAPHLHIELHTPDGERRCIGPLLAAIRAGTAVPTPGILPTSGC